MKKLLLLSTVLFAAPCLFAQTLASWTFESSGLSGSTTYSPGAGTTTTNFLAEGGLQAGTASITGLHAGASVYSSPAGNGSSKSLSSTVWAPGDYYQIQLSTVGFHGLSVSWDQTSSTTGPRDFNLSYSLNGTTFTQIGSTFLVASNAAPNPLWNATTSSSLFSFNQDLGSVIDDSPTVFLRLTVADNSSEGGNGGVISTGGTDRIDNVSVFTTPVPEPAVVTLLGLGGLGLLVRRRIKA